jgi:hypothetical protein
LNIAKQGCRLGKVERGSQDAKGCKVTQFHRDPSIERGDDEHQFYSLDTIIVAKNIPKYCIGSVSSHSATPVYQTADWAAGYTTGTLYIFY